MIEPLGIPYARAVVGFEGGTVRICPVCGEECPEQTDADGETITNAYAEHFEAIHGEMLEADA